MEKLERRIVLTTQCGNVSIGDKTVGIGVSFSRDSMPIQQADGILCGRRIEVILKRGNASPDQVTNPPDAQASIRGTVEVKSFRATTKSYSLTACFMLEDVDPQRLHEFAKRECTLTILKSGEIPAKKKAAPPAVAKNQRSLIPNETQTTDEPVSIGEAVKALNEKRKKAVAERAESNRFNNRGKKKASPKKASGK